MNLLLGHRCKVTSEANRIDSIFGEIAWSMEQSDKATCMHETSECKLFANTNKYLKEYADIHSRME